ncbi:MAG TPA: Fe-S cluster assembly protein SufD [Pseudomonadota bacterium]|nr:Fe-S cluster assembly protein SufD [Pseudomonadota bacterium]
MSSPFLASQLAAFDAQASRLPGARLGWLAEARRANRDALAAGGLPGPRVEGWKYSPLRALERRAFVAADVAAMAPALPPGAWTLAGVEGSRLVFVDGVLDRAQSRFVAEDGVSLLGLAEAMEAGSDGLCHALGERFEGADDAFARLGAALAADGAVLRIAPGVQVRQTVQCVFVSRAGPADLAWHARLVVALGAGARARVIEHHLDAGSHANFGNLLTRVTLDAGAELDWLRISTEPEAATAIARTEVELGAAARYGATALEAGAALSRHELRIRLGGVGARCESRGVFALRGRRHADIALAVDHAARDTTSIVQWRGVADGRARGAFGGTIHVAAGADGADAALSNKNLLLSPHAEIATRPVLEIDADEVKASHGATVGRLEEGALFYLRSRGIPEVEARALLTFAFCREMLDGIVDPALREAVSEQLRSLLPQTEPLPLEGGGAGEGVDGAPRPGNERGGSQ